MRRLIIAQLASGFIMMVGVLGGCSDIPSSEELEQRTCTERYCAELRYDPGAGAMTSAYSRVYVTTAEGLDEQLVFSGDNMDRVTLRWLDQRTLRVSYGGGLITSFTNGWRGSRRSGALRPDVEIVLERTKFR